MADTRNHLPGGVSIIKSRGMRVGLNPSDRCYVFGDAELIEAHASQLVDHVGEESDLLIKGV